MPDELPVGEQPVVPTQVVEPVQAGFTEKSVPTAPVKADAVPDVDFFSSAKTLLKDKGFDPTEVVNKIDANNGKIPLDLYNDLTSKLGVTETNTLVAGYSQARDAANASIEQENQRIYDVVGGKDKWEAAAAWTKTPEAGLTPEAAKAYNKMFAEGGLQAELAANAIMEAYMKSPGFTQAPTLVQGDGPAPILGLTAISRSKYVEEKAKAITANDAVAVKSLEERARHTMQNNPGLWRGALHSF